MAAPVVAFLESLPPLSWCFPQPQEEAPRSPSRLLPRGPCRCPREQRARAATRCLGPALAALTFRSSSMASSCAKAACLKAVLAAVLATLTLKPPPPRSPATVIPLATSRPPCDAARTAIGGSPLMVLSSAASPPPSPPGESVAGRALNGARHRSAGFACIKAVES